jgi:predicted ABC-class ATPase
MKPFELLRRRLRPLDGKDYGAYQSLKGAWGFPRFELHIDRIPKDPYAPPGTGVYRARIPRAEAGFPGDMTASRLREVALRDYLARQFFRQCARISKGRRGTGSSGIITIAEPGQEVLERTSVVVDAEFVEARFFIGLPASNRAIRAALAETMLFEELPRIVEAALFAENLANAALTRHLATVEDAAFLRERLAALCLVAFIADGALLPRLSGVDPTPLDTGTVVGFQSPESLRVAIEVPNAGTIAGMGIPAGVTLIVGGGYHGKSTLLGALGLGVYDHVPGDGRERCVSLPGTMKVRAASGRSIVKTDISAFIADIPLGKPTTSFSTPNASGSTSQAAFIAEAIESGATVLLMDEDTCATNFMIRDKRMQELVPKRNEPITAFVDAVRGLYEDHGISTILVMGGSGDYFSVADHVIQMTEFVAHDVTERAHGIAERFATDRAREGDRSIKRPRRRFPLQAGLDPHNEYGHFRITASAPSQLVFGRTQVDLSDVEQLVERTQTRAIGRAILHTLQYMDGTKDVAQVVAQVLQEIHGGGLDVLDEHLTGDLAAFRGLEFAAALNRIRTLQVRQGR